MQSLLLFSLLSFFCDFTFAASPGTVALVVVVVMPVETPRELAVEAAVVERAVAMPLLFKIVP